MKLNYYQLEQHLSTKLAPVYIVSGDEIFLKQEAIDQLRKTVKAKGFVDRTRIIPEAGFDWEALFSMLYSSSLLAEKRLLEFDFRDSLPNKTASAILKEYAGKINHDNILIIDIAKADDKISKSAWFQALEKIGVVITIWPIPREQLPQWIMNRARRYKLSFTTEAANHLADYIEGNLIAAAQTIEKIYLLQPQKTVDAALLHTILTDESRFTVFDFIETVIAGNQTRMLHILENLRFEGAEPILILWALTRELRLMASLATQLQSGQTLESLFQKNRIFARRQAAVRRFLGKFSAPDCWQMLSHALEIDKMVKGVSPGSSWDGLQLFCLRMQ